jgi:hypothetical protein
VDDLLGLGTLDCIDQRVVTVSRHDDEFNLFFVRRRDDLIDDIAVSAFDFERIVVRETL